ncbi:ATP-binding protein [Pelosinus sp. sgz500959]|uniref:ATP-binding protein n=1 Tax=Pelosinus sp. sgz500959 TaxID=3242472 RepID=UPI00366C11BF
MENRNFKILAIDDNRDNLTLLKALVKDNFPEALFLMALSGEKGLELAAQEDPDVILLDIIMPVMDGFEVCNRLKADNILKEIPVIFLTALKGDKQSRIKALECGAEAFLSKPIDESELIAQIRAMVKIRESYEQKRNEKKRLAKLVEERTAELKAAHLSSLRLLEDLKRENDLRKESERQFQQAIEGAPVPIMLHAEDGEVLSINSTWTELTGYTIKDIPTIESWEKKTAANKLTQEKECIQILCGSDKRQHDGEFLLQMKTGKNCIWDFYTAFIGNLNDGRRMVMRVGIDITDRKQMEQEVRTSEEKYRLIAENVSDVIWVLNVTKSKMTYVSPSIQQLRGITVKEAMDENIEKKLELKSQVFLQEAIKKHLHIFKENPEFADCLITEVQQPCGNGELVWVEMSTKFHYNSDGDMEIIGISRNIEERKRTERELITAKEQAEAANVAKSQFLSNMSHEIRTPMNGVLGFLQLLEYSPINREQQKYINNIKNSTQVLLKVIADILDISKIEADKMTLEKITFDLELEMENSVIPFTATAKEKGLDINLFIRPEVPQVIIGDPLRLKQIIGNLVSNAVKFTEQGEIFIEVSLLAETETEAEINFSIKDTGIGMTEQEVQKNFKPFSQADMSHTRKYGGTGLGLTISKRLIEMMGGHISLISKKERGTIVNFCLWLTKPGESSRPEKLDVARLL